MRVGIAYGRARLDLDVDEASLVAVRRHAVPPDVADPVAAVRDALERPHDFPPLRRALTPDDRVVIVVEERLPRLGRLLTPILEHLSQALITPDAVTILCPPPSGQHEWLNELPVAFREVCVEVHDPTDRRKLSYLATTKQERRVYLNRTAVDADQLVVLSTRGYDPALGYSGAESAIYPLLGDEATRQELTSKWSLAPPGGSPWPPLREAAEVGWLLGAPFLVQVIPGTGDEISRVVGGSLGATAEGQRQLDERWRLSVAEPVGTVLASISGDPARHDFGDLARAAACASRVVRTNGRIIILTEAAPLLGSAGEWLRRHDDASLALEALRKPKSPDLTDAFLWASAAEKAHIYLLSGLPAETAEELFATPLESLEQVRRLLSAEGPCLVLEDAHRTMAVVE